MQMKKRNKSPFIAYALWGLCVMQSVAQQLFTLDDCVRLAMENNAKMKNARLDVEGAREEKKEAFTKYFPTVSAAGSTFAANHGTVDMALGPGMELSMVKNGVMGGVTAVQPLFAGGQIVNGNKLASLAVEVNHCRMRQSEEEVMLTVEQYYWQWIALQEKRKTVGIIEALLGNLQKEVETAVGAGVTTRNELLQVQLKRNGVASNRLQVENALRLSRMVLAQYIGVGEDDFRIDSVMPASVPLPADCRANHEEALPSTTAYKLLDYNVEAKRLQQKMKVGEFLPAVGVGAGYMYHNLMDTDRPFGMVFATVSIPISGWWGGSHAVRRQKLQLKAAEYSRQDTRELLLLRMQKLWNELEESYQQAMLSDESVTVATENVRLNSDYYKAGTVTLSDLLDAQSLLQQSRDQYTNDCMVYLVKHREYLQSVGH